MILDKISKSIEKNETPKIENNSFNPDSRIDVTNESEVNKSISSDIYNPDERVEVDGRRMEIDYEGNRQYYDDNGKLYRTNDELTVNNSYEMNGYVYETDELGRIKSTEGTLHFRNREDRLRIKDSIDVIGKGDQKDNDDRGHIIGDIFDGSNGLENIVPQDALVNRVDYNALEMKLANEMKNGKEVAVDVIISYTEDSRRPECISVIYSIDGDMEIRNFPNERE